MNTDPTTLAQVIRHAVFAADTAVIRTTRENPSATPADLTHAAVREAFRCALGNGLITVVPVGQWPLYVALDPPYDPDVWPTYEPGAPR